MTPVIGRADNSRCTGLHPNGYAIIAILPIGIHGKNHRCASVKGRSDGFSAYDHKRRSPRVTNRTHDRPRGDELRQGRPPIAQDLRRDLHGIATRSWDPESPPGTPFRRPIRRVRRVAMFVPESRGRSPAHTLKTRPPSTSPARNNPARRRHAHHPIGGRFNNAIPSANSHCARRACIAIKARRATSLTPVHQVHANSVALVGIHGFSDRRHVTDRRIG